MVREARAAGLRVAVLSNSLGREAGTRPPAGVHRPPGQGREFRPGDRDLADGGVQQVRAANRERDDSEGSSSREGKMNRRIQIGGASWAGQCRCHTASA